MSDQVAEDPLIGRQLANFRLERIIGRGGMAMVYYGTDVKLNRPVAVKVIDARYRHNPAYAQRFVRESQVVATWRHPNILQVFYADDEEELYYFVMEYIDGLDLRALVDMYNADNQLMPVEDVLRMGYAIADALDYAHAQGVVHRDIKPSNVMAAYDGRVLLMDFGLAMTITEGSMGEVFGTPHYMAPEQARRSADAVPQSDIYSLGILLYEMLTGQVPFDDESPTSVAIMHITQDPPSPRVYNPSLSEQAAEVLLKSLAKEPLDRYMSGRELVDALHNALRGDGPEIDILPPMPAMVQRPVMSDSWANRNMTVAERLALQLDERQSRPSTDTFSPTVPESIPHRRNRWSYAIVVGVVAILLLVGGIGWSVYQLVSATPEPTAPAVAIVEPTDTPTATATPTDTPTPRPTDTPTPTPTEIAIVEIPPTETATPTMTQTPTPTHTPTPTITPSATPLPSILLIYNDLRVFYVYNFSDATVDVGQISFLAVDNDGQFTEYGFRASRWGGTRIESGKCSGIEVGFARPNLRDGRCEGFNWLDFPGENAEEIFWVTRSEREIFKFAVQYEGRTIQTCATEAGLCAVSLP